MVYQSLDEVVSVWAGKGTEADCEEPYVEVCDSEPRLECRGKVAFYVVVIWLSKHRDEQNAEKQHFKMRT